jgi:hypothetical protein
LRPEGGPAPGTGMSSVVVSKKLAIEKLQSDLTISRRHSKNKDEDDGEDDFG